jgi:hypothetical protein
MSNKKGPKKVRFYETNVQDQIGLFKTAEYNAPPELINNIKQGTNQNTTMNIRQNYMNRINFTPNLPQVSHMMPEFTREACIKREFESRFDMVPYENINAVESGYGFRFGDDSRANNKRY